MNPTVRRSSDLLRKGLCGDLAGMVVGVRDSPRPVQATFLFSMQSALDTVVRRNRERFEGQDQRDLFAFEVLRRNPAFMRSLDQRLVTRTLHASLYGNADGLVGLSSLELFLPTFLLLKALIEDEGLSHKEVRAFLAGHMNGVKAEIDRFCKVHPDTARESGLAEI